eukprot:CAMPEP_0206618248 /NCGR_PEP_ID=MMETSP0325_2-20121206/60125_1 /ASSEMBLY_ACC=CAM_ASM_000347 /TAXON_ID=2866 /ORGANISM="Crypthecodinium cohnii, Strain Seligo" /LENGTH=132 /DNA_ID=CAMNT_0054140401 /DNA_START=234 /DNA_END=629 /DNA_ORIENTATION=-
MPDAAGVPEFHAVVQPPFMGPADLVLTLHSERLVASSRLGSPHVALDRGRGIVELAVGQVHSSLAAPPDGLDPSSCLLLPDVMTSLNLFKPFHHQLLLQGTVLDVLLPNLFLVQQRRHRREAELQAPLLEAA